MVSGALPNGEDADPIQDSPTGSAREPGVAYVTAGVGADGQPADADYGQPQSVIFEVFDENQPTRVSQNGSVWTVESADEAAGRYQIKLLMTRSGGDVSDIWVQHVPLDREGESASTVLHLHGVSAQRLVQLMSNLAFISVRSRPDGSRTASPPRVEPINSAELLDRYRHDPDEIRALIVNDRAARDVVAIARRRDQVDEFRRLLSDDDHFDAVAAAKGGPERVWQAFAEANPWIFGVSLGGQLFTSFDESRLERAVTGPSIAGPGKRADAVLRTAGIVRSMVFVELKHHRTELLGGEYRSGCWSVSPELAGAVAQSQGTAHLAVATVGDRLQATAPDGSDIPGEFTYLFEPRSYVVIGHLRQLSGEGGALHTPKIRSFELYRRNLHQPEVITFDELLARAEWLVDGTPAAAAEATSGAIPSGS